MRSPSMRPHKRLSGRFATGVTVFLAVAIAVSLAACATQQPADEAPVEPSQQEMESVSIDISDDWKGALSISGQQLELIFHVEAADDGSLSATFDVPAQGAYGVAFESVSIDSQTAESESPTITFTAPQAGIEYEATLSASGEELSGTWRQGGAELELILERQGERVPELSRPQEPKPPFPYGQEEVSIESAEGVALAGTLTLPNATEPVPGIVLITGSGPQDRNEEIFGHKPFLVIADALTRAGIAVLRYDDRGVAESTGDMVTATSEDFAVDAQAVFSYLRARPEIDPSQVGFLGHSEGGMIAPAVAARNENVAFVVLLAAPAVPTVDLLLKQNERLLRAAGAGDAQIAAANEVNQRIYEAVLSNPDDEEAARIVSGIMKEIGVSEEQSRAQVEALLAPWYRYFLAYDPRPALESLDCAVLALFGSLDLQVDAEQNAPAMRDALEAAPTTTYTVETVPSVNHLFQTATTGSVQEYAQIEETIAPSVLATITDWLGDVTGK